MNAYLPIVPFSHIDLCNRRAAATGSFQYAMGAKSADYNGHHVTVGWNSYRGYWIAEYFYGERVVLCRGSLVECLLAAQGYHARGAKGATVVASYPNKWYPTDHNKPPESVMQFCAVCAREGYTLGREAAPYPWWTPEHDAVSEAFSYERYFPGIVGIACNLKGQPWAEARDAYITQRRKA